MFENRALRKIFGPKNDEVTGVEKLNDLYSSTEINSGDQIKRMRLAWHVE